MKMRPLPSQELLHTLFDYDPESGEIRWKRSGHGVSCGDLAGKWRDGRLRLKIQGIDYSASRVIWMYVTGKDPSPYEIDHKDRDQGNNRFLNLREATSSQQKFNSLAVSMDHSTGVKGVYKRSSGRFSAEIQVEGKRIYLGRYDTIEEAKRIRQAAAEKYHGEFTCL